MNGRNGRWARIEKAIDLTSPLAILVLVGVFLVQGHDEVAVAFMICLFSMLASGPYHDRRREQIRRGKEILNRYSLERNPRPLGL